MNNHNQINNKQELLLNSLSNFYKKDNCIKEVIIPTIYVIVCVHLFDSIYDACRRRTLHAK